MTLDDRGETISASFLAELSVSSPRKLFIFIILKKNLDQSIQKIFYLILKKEALEMMSTVRSITPM